GLGGAQRHTGDEKAPRAAIGTSDDLRLDMNHGSVWPALRCLSTTCLEPDEQPPVAGSNRIACNRPEFQPSQRTPSRLAPSPTDTVAGTPPSPGERPPTQDPEPQRWQQRLLGALGLRGVVVIGLTGIGNDEVPGPCYVDDGRVGHHGWRRPYAAESTPVEVDGAVGRAVRWWWSRSAVTQDSKWSAPERTVLHRSSEGDR
ncbi:MAG: hypothetical protein ACO307_02480, partial [Ilumatobacteraceae bacterium]